MASNLTNTQNSLIWKANTVYKDGDNIRQLAGTGSNRNDYLFVGTLLTGQTEMKSSAAIPEFSSIVTFWKDGDSYNAQNSVQDNGIRWAAVKYYSAAEDSVDFWFTTSPTFELPDQVNNALTNITNAVGLILPVMDAVLVYAELSKIFLVGFGNPLVKAMIFLLDQIIEYIDNLKKGGFHGIYITPAQGLGTFKKWDDFTPDSTLLQPFLDWKPVKDTTEDITNSVDTASAFAGVTFDTIGKKYKEIADTIGLKEAKTINTQKTPALIAAESKLASDAAKKESGTETPADIAKKEADKQDTRPDGFYALSTQQTIDYFVNSFDDDKDQSRPPNSSGVYAGGIVIFFGIKADAESIVNTIESVYKFLSFFAEGFQEITKEFETLKVNIAKVLDVNEEYTLTSPIYKNGEIVEIIVDGNPILFGTTDSMVLHVTLKIKLTVNGVDIYAAGDKIELLPGKDFYLDANKKTIHFPLKGNMGERGLVVGDILTLRETYTEPPSTQKTKPPVWHTLSNFEILSEFGVGDVFDTVNDYLKAIKKNFDAVGGAIDKLIASIEKEIAFIEELIAKVEKLITDINAIKCMLNELSKGDILRILEVEAQVGGIDKMKQLVQDTSLVGAPPSDLNYTGMVAWVGSGPGMSLLQKLMSPNPNSKFEFNLPSGYSTLTDNEKMKAKIGAMSNTELIAYQEKVKNRVKDRVEFLEKNTTVNVSSNTKKILIPDYDPNSSPAEKTGC